MRAIRSNLFVPVPQVWSVESLNAKLPAMCMALSEKDHYLKDEPERQLFVEDQAAMLGLPERPFRAVTWERRRADKYGKVKVRGPHWYSTDPALAGSDLVVGIGAATVTVLTEAGEPVAEHARQFGEAPTDTTDPGSQLAVLAYKSRGWASSKVRAALPAALRERMDGLPEEDLRAELRAMRDVNAERGWAATVAAMAACVEGAGRVDAAALEVAAARLAGGSIAYDEPVDLSAYDAAVGMGVA